jgi:DNA-binding MarR family transcriptional regulator
MADTNDPAGEELLGSAQIFSEAVSGLLDAQLVHANLDLAMSQIRLLTAIQKSPGAGVSELADYLDVSRAAVSRAVDRLVRRGLVDRVPGEDRREVDLSLTASGREALVRFRAAVQESMGELLGEMSPDRVQEAISLLDRLSLLMVQRYAEVGEPCFRCGIHFREKCVLRRAVGRRCVMVMEPVHEPTDVAND